MAHTLPELPYAKNAPAQSFWLTTLASTLPTWNSTVIREPGSSCPASRTMVPPASRVML